MLNISGTWGTEHGTQIYSQKQQLILIVVTLLLYMALETCGVIPPETKKLENKLLLWRTITRLMTIGIQLHLVLHIIDSLLVLYNAQYWYNYGDGGYVSSLPDNETVAANITYIQTLFSSSGTLWATYSQNMTYFNLSNGRQAVMGLGNTNESRHRAKRSSL